MELPRRQTKPRAIKNRNTSRGVGTSFDAFDIQTENGLSRTMARILFLLRCQSVTRCQKLLFLNMGHTPRPLFLYFRTSLSTMTNIVQNVIMKAEMVCLGFEPWTGKWQVQTNPLNYVQIIFHLIGWSNCSCLSTTKRHSWLHVMTNKCDDDVLRPIYFSEQIEDDKVAL